MIWDAKILTKSFCSFNFSHVGHEGNFVTHNIAMHVIHVTGLWKISDHASIFQANLAYVS